MLATGAMLDALLARVVGAPLLQVDAAGMAAAMQLPAGLADGSDGGGGVAASSGERQLFEREADNFHEEPLQQAHLGAYLLRAALRRSKHPVATQAAARWAEALRARRRGAARDAAASPLGTSRHAASPGVFLWESRIELALWALDIDWSDPDREEGDGWPSEEPPLAFAELLEE